MLKLIYVMVLKMSWNSELVGISFEFLAAVADPEGKQAFSVDVTAILVYSMHAT